MKFKRNNAANLHFILIFATVRRDFYDFGQERGNLSIFNVLYKVCSFPIFYIREIREIRVIRGEKIVVTL